MELDELLDREGLDPDELMTWAHRRAEQLLAELPGGSDELTRLLEPAAQIDLEDVPVRRVTVAQDMLSARVNAVAGQVEAEADESITVPISLEDGPDDGSNEPDAAEVGTRGRRRLPSRPQPLSASELPPPPEHTRLADGEPEPMLETVDTGPIDLGSAEARAMIAANSSRFTLLDMDHEDHEDVAEAAARQAVDVSSRAEEPEALAFAELQSVSEADEPESASESEAASETDTSEEFEIDELEELDDEELELLVDVDDSGDDAEVAPPPPPRPPPSKPAQPSAAAPPPAKPVDNHVDMDDLIAGLADSE